jgi:hypothetical protein
MMMISQVLFKEVALSKFWSVLQKKLLVEEHRCNPPGNNSVAVATADADKSTCYVCAECEQRWRVG